MAETDIWRGLEREIGAACSRVAFEEARERHEALRVFPDLSAAAAAAARQRSEARDALVTAFVVECRTSRVSVWTAAVTLSMAPALQALVRELKNALGDQNDAKSIVLAAFLEAVNAIGPTDRITFRLYSETRRRALRVRRVAFEEGRRRCVLDVESLSCREVNAEERVDQARIVLRADAVAPERDESPAAYLERLLPSRSLAEQRGRRARLKSHRIATVIEVREQFRRITRHPHLTETPE